MKNIKFINIIMALALVCFGLTACSSDNDDNGGEGGGGTGGGGSVAKLAEPYFGVNMSGAEFAAVYPGIDGTQYFHLWTNRFPDHRPGIRIGNIMRRKSNDTTSKYGNHGVCGNTDSAKIYRVR